MKLNINIVVLNGLNFTKRAVESIATKYPFKLRIIDQDSKDGTREWCLGNKIDCITMSPKISLSEAWNFGIKESMRDTDCEYIFFPNNDIILHPKTIDNLIDAYEKSGYVMVTGNNVASKVDPHDFKDFEPETEEYKPITDWRQQGPDFSCPLIGRDFVEKCGWFDENYFPCFYEDNDMHLRIIKKGMVAKRIASAPYYHYGSQTAMAEGVTSSLAGNYFSRKWNASPAICMDGGGYQKPFNDKDLDWWEGCKKYD